MGITLVLSDVHGDNRPYFDTLNLHQEKVLLVTPVARTLPEGSQWEQRVLDVAFDEDQLHIKTQQALTAIWRDVQKGGYEAVVLDTVGLFIPFLLPSIAWQKDWGLLSGFMTRLIKGLADSTNVYVCESSVIDDKGDIRPMTNRALFFNLVALCTDAVYVYQAATDEGIKTFYQLDKAPACNFVRLPEETEE